MNVKYCSMSALCLLVLMTAGCRRQAEHRQQPVIVRVMKVQPMAVAAGQEFSGTVEESSGSTLSFPVAGTVRRVCVETGQRVTEGQLLATLDEAALQSSYDAAAAALEQAEDAWRRMSQLHDSGSLPEMQWVEMQSRLKQAQAAERIARKTLADGRLYAPFTGVISEKAVEVGHNVMPGMPVVRLVTVGTVKVCISVPENEISHIAMGQPVSVRVSALDGRAFSGKVVEKGITADPLSRSYKVKAAVENHSGSLMPGMVCTLCLGADGGVPAIVLPARVVQTDEANRRFVWINDNGKARRRMIVTGRLDRNGVQVSSGLTAGDEVLVEGQQKVSENMNITIGR